jgi:L-cysteine:1D-myo-inositol 2-amino-2-deoxy-alpha-D-glucopyranoside ligase
LVGYQGEKMSKSLGNLVFLKDLADQGFDPSEIRLALLLQDWRKPWEFNFNLMESAREMLKRWKSAYLDSKLPKIDVFIEVISRNLLHGLFIHQTLLGFDKCISSSNTSSDREIVSEYLDSLFGINIKSMDGEANE